MAAFLGGVVGQGGARSARLRGANENPWLEQSTAMEGNDCKVWSPVLAAASAGRRALFPRPKEGTEQGPARMRGSCGRAFHQESCSAQPFSDQIRPVISRQQPILLPRMGSAHARVLLERFGVSRPSLAFSVSGGTWQVDATGALLEVGCPSFLCLLRYLLVAPGRQGVC